MTTTMTSTLQYKIYCATCKKIVGYKGIRDNEDRLIRALPNGKILQDGERMGCDESITGYHKMKMSPNDDYCETCKGTGEVTHDAGYCGGCEHCGDREEHEGPCPDCRGDESEQFDD